MKNSLTKIAAVILVVAVIIVGIGVAAAQGDGLDNGSEVRVLAVEVPGLVEVDTPVIIKVTDRESGTPVSAVSVYALTWPILTVTDMAGVIPSGMYNSEFLGKTMNDGTVVHSFDSVGRVLIVATKEQWGPGLARLTVKPYLEGKLVVRAPIRAKVDEPVTIGVVERENGEAVAGADVWAIKRPFHSLTEGIDTQAEEIKGLIEGIGGNEGGNFTEILAGIAEHLGQTNNNGELKHAFGEVGRYLLVATMNGYVPGFKVITIVADKALVIKADPRRADIAEDVVFTAKTRGAGTPVADVDLYALGFPFPNTNLTDLRAMSTEGTLEQMAIDSGTFMGTTNEDGQWTYQFQEEGVYLVVGIKDSYIPGITFVCIGQFDGLRELLPFPQIKRFGEGVDRDEAIPQLNRFERERNQQRLFPQIKRFSPFQ